MATLIALLGASLFGAIALQLYGATSAAIVTFFSTLAAISLEQTVIPVLIAVLSSGFIFGLFKIMPERRSILVQASENAVKVVNDAISTLQKELTEARLEIARLETDLAAAKSDRDKFGNELQSLRTKVTRLEAQLDMYERIRGASQSVQREQGERRKDDRPFRGPEKRKGADREWDDG